MENEQYLKEIKPFLDKKGRVKSLPSKHKKKLLIYYYLAEKIEIGRDYTETEINDVLNDYTLFRDPATLRREMFNTYLLNRTQDCRRYWREEAPDPDEFMRKHT